MNAPFLPLKGPNAALVKRGEELAKAGGPERLHCDNCHGPGGSGEPPMIPYLAGQHAHYIAFTLQMWQEGFRKNSPDVMGAIAKKLDDQDILAVAAYYQQLQSTLETVESQGKDEGRCRPLSHITRLPRGRRMSPRRSGRRRRRKH